MRFFEEIKTYVGFTEEDGTRLEKLGPLMKPYFGDVVVAFYEALMEHPRARAVFDGPEQVQRLRVSLKQWLAELFEGKYDDQYFRSRSRIGLAHVRVGLMPQFMFGAMNIIRFQLTERLMSLGEGELNALLGQESAYRVAVNSIDRILDIELTIMVQSYWDELMRRKLKIPAALATGLAHEIRNPLNAIGLQMTMLERRLQNSAVDSGIYESVMEAVRTELGRIQNLNSEILDFARPIVLDCGPVELTGLLREVYRSHGPTLEAGGVIFHISGADRAEILGDRARLSQVFVNLLTNAIEAMPDGGEIEVELEVNGSGVVVEFRDSGIGVATDEASQIFELFHTTKALGTGIGLPIAKKIVEAHGGTIDVAIRKLGASFRIYFPYQGCEPTN